METLTIIISVIIFIVLFLAPIFLFLIIKKWTPLKFEFMSYLFLGMIIKAGTILIFAWWGQFSDQLLLSKYGYNFDAMNESERFREVASENMARVKQLEIGYLGIGWPVKAIMTFVFYSPYLLIVYVIGNLIRKNREHSLNSAYIK